MSFEGEPEYAKQRPPYIPSGRKILMMSDLHLRDVAPEHRTDDYFASMQSKLRQIEELRNKHNTDILDGGDLFHKWKVSPWLLGWAIRNLPENIYTVAGNHDMPGHNFDNIEKSGLHVLTEAEKVTLLNSHDPLELGNMRIYGVNYKGQIPAPDKIKDRKNILVCHEEIYRDDATLEKIGFISTDNFLSKWSKHYDFILTGHNHKSFCVKTDDCILLNPGSLMRMKSDQKEHIPCVWLYDSGANTIEKVVLEYEKIVFDNHTAEKMEARNSFSEFVKSIETGFEHDMRFESNVEKFMSANSISESVKKLTVEMIEGTYAGRN